MRNDARSPTFPGPAKFTFEGWFLGPADGDTEVEYPLFEYQDYNGPRLNYLDGELIAKLTQPGCGYYDSWELVAAVDLFDDVWHSVAMSVDAPGAVRIYVDGIEVGSADFPGGLHYKCDDETTEYVPDSVANSFYVGEGYSIPSWPGRIAEAAVYDKVLTPRDLRQNYVASGREGNPNWFTLDLLGVVADFLGLVGDPVNTLTGRLMRSESDLSSPPGVYGLRMDRTYNSGDVESSDLWGYGDIAQNEVGFGLGWTHWLASEAWLDPADDVIVRMPDGRLAVFRHKSTGGWTAPPDIQGEIVEVDPDGAGPLADVFALQFVSGERWVFGADGLIMQRCERVVTPTDEECSTGDGQVVSVSRTASTVEAESSVGANGSTDGWRLVLNDTGTPDSRFDSAELFAPGQTTPTQSVSYEYKSGSPELLESATTEAGAEDPRVRYVWDTGRIVQVHERYSGTTERATLEVGYDTEGRVIDQWIDPTDPGTSTPGGDPVRFFYDQAWNYGSSTLAAEDDATTVRFGTATDGYEYWVYRHEGYELTSITDPKGKQVDRDYDTGQLSSFTDRNDADWTNEFDDHGRLCKRSRPNPDPSSSTDVVEEFHYVGETVVCGVAGDDPRMEKHLAANIDATAATFNETTLYDYADLDGAGTADDGTDAVPSTVTVGAQNTAQDATTTIYSQDDLVLKTVDPDGVATCFEWDTGTRELDKRKEACGTSAEVVTEYLYEPATGRLQTVREDTSTGGTTDTRYGYDAAGRVTSVTTQYGTVDAATTTTGYYPDGRIRYTVDPVGAVTCHETTWGATSTVVEVRHLDAYSTVTTGTECSGTPAARVTEATYDLAGRQTLVKEGHTAESTWAETTFAYGVLSRLDSVTDPEGRVTHYLYDDDGNVTHTVRGASATDTALERTWETKYDRWGRATEQLSSVLDSTEGSLQQRSTTEYDYQGRVLFERTFDGTTETQTTKYVYDAKGLLLETQGPRDLAEAEVRTYTDAGRLKTITDRESNTTTYYYEDEQSTPVESGRLWRVLDPEQALASTPAYMTYTYDDAGRTATVTTPGGIATSYAYDALGRTTAVTTPDPSNSTATVTAESFYNNRGDLTRTETPHGGTDAITQYSYYPTGEILRVVDPRGAYPYGSGDKAGVTEYTYDGRGNRDTRTTYVSDDGLGVTWTTLVEDWDYNLASQIDEHTDLAGNVTDYTYDTTFGRLASTATGGTSDASYRVEHLDYNNWGAIRRRCFDDDTNATDCMVATDTTSELVTYTYDALGRRATMTDPRSTTATTYTYGDDVNLTKITHPDASEIEWTFDANANPTDLVYPDGATYEFEYDANNRLEVANVLSGGTPLPLATYTYDADGRVTEDKLFLSNGKREHIYNWAGQLKEYRETINGTTGLWNYVGYDKAGRIASVREGLGNPATLYTYDKANQLLSADYQGTGTDLDWAYTYDEQGRRLTQTHDTVTTDYTWNDANELDSETTSSITTDYTYDAAGRRTGWTRGSDDATWDYNPRGLPAEIEVNEGTDTTTQTRTYDGDGRMATIDVVENTVTTVDYQLTWDPQASVPQILEMRTSPTSWIRNNYGLNRISYLDGCAHWYSYDVHGSALETTWNAGGTCGTLHIEAPNGYDPYGQTTDTVNTPIYYGYRAELHTDDLIHLRNRDYDPSTGTFDRHDPLDGVNGTPTVANPYHYTDNDPLNKTDPLGLRAEDHLVSMSDAEHGEVDIARGPIATPPWFAAFNVWHRATQLDLTLWVPGSGIECPVKGGGPNGGTGRIDVCLGNAEMWEVKYFGPASMIAADAQLRRYTLAGAPHARGHVVQPSVVIAPDATPLFTFSPALGVRLYIPERYLFSPSLLNDPVRVKVLDEIWNGGNYAQVVAGYELHRQTVQTSDWPFTFGIDSEFARKMAEGLGWAAAAAAAIVGGGLSEGPLGENI